MTATVMGHLFRWHPVGAREAVAGTEPGSSASCACGEWTAGPLLDNAAGREEAGRLYSTHVILALVAQLREYDRRITWNTTCKNCADMLDKSYEDYARAEQLREQVKQVLSDTEWDGWPGRYLLVPRIHAALKDGGD